MPDNLQLYFMLIYLIIILGVICFQIALIFGAPWGRITQGGIHEGALPTSARIIAFISIILLMAMVLSMLSITGHEPNWPRWTGWATVAINLIMCILNWITHSTSERILWGPITSIILLLAFSIMLI